MTSNQVKVNLSDATQIKNALDDCLIKFLESQSYVQDYTISNWQLLLGILSVMFALTAQYFPLEFPHNYYVLLVCCTSYFILSGILTFISSYIEKDFIMFSKPIENKGNGIQVRSNLPKYEYDYTFAISEKGTGQNEESLTKSVTNYFTEDGYLVDSEFLKDVKSLLSRYEEKVRKEIQKKKA